MLISRVSEVADDAGVGRSSPESRAGAEGNQREYDHEHEYQTANELFELMARNHKFDGRDENTLSKRDLVILYKNIDIGTKLMSNTSVHKLKKPNQHVETIIYNEDPESDGSDISEIYSTEDLKNVVLINKERIDLFNNRPSLQNTLCHKLGDLEIQSSDLTTDYDKHFLFKDPYIKEQLKNMNLSCCSNGFEGTILPASLLDYICCKRLEDNYNFYMDNIIRYVQHTIEQLKRISNGDYLTDKAREKWREVEHTAKECYEDNTKVLATSTSIPLHVERKFGGHTSTWDDLVHSEVDVRSLSKILEKKIIVEVPKLIYGSYRLFSKRCDDNFIISCKREKPSILCKEEGTSRVDLVLQLQRSQTGQVMSNISSIMILQTTPTTQRGVGAVEVFPLPYEKNNEESIENKVKVIELKQHNDDATISKIDKNEHSSAVTTEEILNEDGQYEKSTVLCISESCNSENKDIWQFHNDPYQESCDSSNTFRNILNKKAQRRNKGDTFNFVTPDDLRLTIQRLNKQSSLLEASSEDITANPINKKKSPTRVRIKSPYENKSYVMEEKKRKKLLEIRERREKKKIALSENCKISKHKYGKVIMPQASCSVTKLSITNKSFYNSIYGQAMNADNNQQKKGRPNRKDSVIDVPLAIMADEDEYVSPMVTPEKNSEKYINRSYYLDDAVTEVMYMEMKKKERNEDKDICSASTSVVSNEFCKNLSLLSQLIAPSTTKLNIKENTTTFQDKLQSNGKKGRQKSFTTSASMLNMVTPANTPRSLLTDEDKKTTSSVECRKSIDKIYDLMDKLGKTDSTEIKEGHCKFTTSNIERMEIICGRGSSTVQGSDSGTSIKHHSISSNPSCFSFNKTNTNEVSNHKTMLTKTPEIPTAVVPKVIISSKIINSKMDTERMKRERKKVTVTHPAKVTDNPLKAISQLIHEFDNVQKCRQKSDTKAMKKADTSSIDAKSISRQSIDQVNPKRHSRLDQHLKDKETPIDRYIKGTPRDRKTRPLPTVEVSKTLHQHFSTEEKNNERLPKKKIIDIIEEAKEARGEAVRGPSKMNRLNTLAQPKRSYVQAHSEEYHTKYGKNVMADRLHRLAATPVPITERTLSANSKYKLKRSGPEVVSPVCGRPQPPPVPLLDRASKARRSSSNSPEGGIPPAFVPSTKTQIPDSPEKLKKKMVAVESYVKNHYGRVTQTAGNTDLLQSVAKSRVPLIPRDIELESMTSSSIVEESTEIGSKLHRIINTIINTAPSLAVLTECHETVSKDSKETTGDICLTKNKSLCQNIPESIGSDYRIDVLEDSTVFTAVQNVDKKEDELIPKKSKIKTKELKPFTSATEMEKLESALYRQMSGTFQKRLRLKNLTLTPKQSMQQVFVLQSGDAASLLVQSTISKNSNISEKSALATALPILTKAHIDLNFAKFPMQIATVEYGLPKYQTVQCGTGSKLKLDMCQKSSDINSMLENSDKSDKTSQCFQGQSISRLRQTAAFDSKTMILKNRNNFEGKADCEKCNEIRETGLTNQLIPTNQTLPTFDKKDKAKMETSDTVDYTSSLDILVGLLNEIQKITSSQAHITNSGNNNDHKGIETILKDAVIFEGAAKIKPNDLISLSSLDELRQLESNPSIYSFYLTNDGDREAIDSKIRIDHDIPFNIINAPYSKPIYADKEVSVDFLAGGYVNRFNDIPSHFFPITVSHSTNVTKSLMNVLSSPSSESTDYQNISSNNFESKKNIIEMRQVATSTDSQHALKPSRIHNVEKKSACKQKVIANILNKGSNEQNAHKCNLSTKIAAKNNCLISGLDCDPIMKMKRDILVTVYSILVFTVFAALSFPELLYHV